MSKVFVGMSGGVDSSVAAALLIADGHDVVGVTFQLESGCDDNGCCGAEAIRDAKLVCGKLGIPHYILNYRELFSNKVVVPFINQTIMGNTTNPCVTCNKDIKFGAFLSWALLNGADYVASGHYAKIVNNNGEFFLARAKDASKDQSYFLNRLSQEQLSHVLFPLASLTKVEVRELAVKFGIHVAKKKDSQGACFVSKNYSDFVKNNFSNYCVAGDVLSIDGKVIGQHRGSVNYTLGQRRGGISYNPGTVHPERFVVIGKNIENNTVIVGEPDNLLVDSQMLDEGFINPDYIGKEVIVVSRYHSDGEIAIVNKGDSGDFCVSFNKPHVRTASGQSMVFYDSDGKIVGGGYAIDSYSQNQKTLVGCLE